MKRRRVLGTTMRGRRKIYSMKQIRYLEFKELPYTRYVYRNGRLVRKVRRNVR